MSSGKNKESLMAFVSDYWSTYLSPQLSGLSCLYVTSNTKCIRLTPGKSASDPVIPENIPELESNHEEADTRLLLHVKHAAQTYDHLIVKTPDTDVFVICTAMQKKIGKDLYLLTGTGKKFRAINITSISDALGEDLCQCLPSFHAFTGEYNLYVQQTSIKPCNFFFA